MKTNKFKFQDIVQGKEGLLKGPFGSDLKKSLYVPKSENTYKVYLQENILKQDKSKGEHYISDTYFNEKMKRYEVSEGDFIVTCDGTLGRIYQLRNIVEKGIISSSLLRITLNKELVDEDFFLYHWSSNIKEPLIRSHDNSVLKHLPGVQAIREFEIILPELKEQQKIGHFLKNIDSKIELNNKINKELESMAKTLYDYWFVQFDFPDENGKPYKSSGGKMVYNQELKREIPDGWEVDSLWNIATYFNGLAMQKHRPVNDNKLRVIKIKEMNEGFGDYTEYAKADVQKEAIINNGDILFSWSASLDVIIWAKGIGALNQHIFKVTSKKYPRSFYYYELINYLKHFKMMADLRKTTMGHITQEHLKQSKIVIPPIDLIMALDNKINVFIEKQILLQQQNQELAKLRDWLLPMLMNGQVKVEI